MLHFRCLLLQSFLLCSVIFFQRCSAQDFQSGYPGYQPYPPPRPRCRPDEVWKDCDSACPPTCDNYGKSTTCTLQCVPGCFCKEGSVRHKDGRCIIPERCDKKSCNNDEELKTCGSSCPDTCNNYGTLRKCTADCVKGCFCKRGLVRNSDFRCIIPEKCNKHVCNPDEVHKDCGTACPATCDSIVSRFKQLVLCPKICVKGCFCKDGSVRNLDTMRCVPPKECHPHGNCGKNAFYSKCASKCPPSCKKYNKPCPDVCVEGCVCKKGLVFDDNGDCIPKCHCPGNNAHCGPNEEFDKCRYHCEPTCKDPKPHCTHECKKGCFCKDGFVRSEKTGECVRKEHCDKPRCRKNEYYDPCRKECEPTCKDPHPVCIPECKEGCYCKPGFIRLDRNRPCVPIKFCKKKKGHHFY